jgi:cell division septation protein DedD
MHAAEKSPPDAVETPVPVAVQTPNVSEPKPLAAAVTNELGKQHAEKLLPAPAPETNLAATKAMPASIPAAKKPAQTATWVPPRPKKRPPRASPSASRGNYRIQLHALASDAAVRREWRRLRQRYGALLGDLELTVTPVRPKAGKTVYRMQLGALSNLSQARTLCKKLRRKKLNCLVVR